MSRPADCGRSGWCALNTVFPSTNSRTGPTASACRPDACGRVRGALRFQITGRSSSPQSSRLQSERPSSVWRGRAALYNAPSPLTRQPWGLTIPAPPSQPGAAPFRPGPLRRGRAALPTGSRYSRKRPWSIPPPNHHHHQQLRGPAPQDQPRERGGPTGSPCPPRPRPVAAKTPAPPPSCPAALPASPSSSAVPPAGRAAPRAAAHAPRSAWRNSAPAVVAR